MQTQALERDDIDREAIAELARDWYKTGPSARERALATFPELARMGLKLTDPYDPALEEQEETLRQCDALDGRAAHNPIGNTKEFAETPDSSGGTGGVPVGTPPPSAPATRPAAKPLSTNLKALFKQARSDPYNEAGHGVIADAIEEEHPGSPFPELIRRQFGLGQHAGQRRDNNWYDPVENSWDGTFPYAARLGTHGPFDVYLRHEGQEGQTPRWVVHAVARVNRNPALNDFGYTFEFPHEEAHLIPEMFPAARPHIHTNPLRGSSDLGRPVPNGAAHYREVEAQKFVERMDEEERNRA